MSHNARYDFFLAQNCFDDSGEDSGLLNVNSLVPGIGFFVSVLEVRRIFLLIINVKRQSGTSAAPTCEIKQFVSARWWAEL